MRRRNLIKGRVAARHQPMKQIIDILRDEHRNIEKLLLVLDRELSVFNRAERPDYHVVQSVIEYFQDYPDCCHHPKEDMIFAKLKARDPVTAASIGDLEAEHGKGSKRLARVARTVEGVLADREILRDTVDAIIRDFIDHERRHMAMEERVLFPAAAQGPAAAGLGRDLRETSRPEGPFGHGAGGQIPRATAPHLAMGTRGGIGTDAARLRFGDSTLAQSTASILEFAGVLFSI